MEFWLTWDLNCSQPSDLKKAFLVALVQLDLLLPQKREEKKLYLLPPCQDLFKDRESILKFC